MYKIETEDVYEDFSTDKEMLDFSHYSAGSNFYSNSGKLVVGKMKNEATGVAIKEFVALKPKLFSFLVNDNSVHKKAKNVNKNVIATISHTEYKDVFFNKKCFWYSMNRVQSKNHRMGKYEINKISLPCLIKYTSKTMDMMY